MSLASGEELENQKEWQKIGTVSHWMDLDSRFYRILDDNLYLDRSQFSLDQKKAYGESKVWLATFPDPLGLDQFRALSSEEQADRRKLALKQVDFVTRFLMVQDRRVQETRENIPDANFNRVQNRANLTDCLRFLGHATGLDPENYYAWHLQAYFAACCGDGERSHNSLLAAARALKEVPSDKLVEMKQRVMLDLAWLERDLGLFEKATGRLDVAARLGKVSVEAVLLRGLIAAQTGDQSKALEMSSQLRSQPVRVFPTDYTTATMSPQLVNVLSWQKVNSDYLQNWILALMELQKGDIQLATSTFREYSTNRHYPFAARFWNDAGMIYERTGRYNQALQAWEFAKINRPWLLHMIYKPYGLRLGELTGSPGPVGFTLGFNSFYLTGSRLAYGAIQVGEMAALEDLPAKQATASRALDQLEICQRTGQYSGQANVLQGQVYFLMQDYAGAQAELKQALVIFEKEGDEANIATSQKDLKIIQQKLSGESTPQVNSQSGLSRGRWVADPDPEATETDLVARLEEDPTNDAVRLELARHYIRNNKAEQGRQLAFPLYDPGNIDTQTIEVVTLVLEADRVLGKDDMADLMIRQLGKGQADQWDDAGLWSLVGAICQDHGRDQDARKALEMALKLDPDNQGIRNQLLLMD